MLYVFSKGSCDKDIDIDDVQSKVKTPHVDAMEALCILRISSKLVN